MTFAKLIALVLIRAGLRIGGYSFADLTTSRQIKNGHYELRELIYP
jgi:hypothetical protein